MRISQAELAKRMDEGLSQQAISKWIQHNKVPEERIPKLTEVLGPDAEVVKLAQKQEPSTRAMERPSMYQATPVKAREEPDIPDLRAHTEERRMQELLPEHLQPNVGVRIALTTRALQFDYLSDALALELRSLALPAGLMSAASRSSHQLQLLRRLMPGPSQARRYAVAILVHENLMDARHIDMVNALTGELALLGITLLVVPSIEHVVRYIVSVEEAAAGGHRDLFADE